MTTQPSLLGLMPAVYRLRDPSPGAPLQTLFEALQAQYDLIHDDISALYDDWFVETCETWLLPYISELVAGGRLARRLHPGINTRGLVGDTLAHRRRKGVHRTLEEVLSYATGWPARVIEPHRRLAISPTAIDLGRRGARAASVGDRAALSVIGGAFDNLARLPRVGRGGLEPNALAIQFWRLQSAPLYGVDGGVIAGGPGRRTFHPAGLDMPLFNTPGAPTAAASDIRRFPTPLSRHTLAEDLATNGETYGWLKKDPAFAIRIGGAPVTPEMMTVGDLSIWTRPEDSEAKVVVDPERGRLLLLDEADHHAAVETDHSYGFPDDLGGGAYRRPATPTALDTRTGCWRRLRIANSRTVQARRRKWRDGAWRIDLSKRNLAVSAADGERPCLIGDIEIAAHKTGGTIILDGLMIAGALKIEGRATVILRHCTILPQPGRSAIKFKRNAVAARLILEHAVIGPIEVQGDDIELHADHSIFQGIDGREAEGGAILRVNACSIDGEVRCRVVHAVDTQFLGPVSVADISQGAVDHCWLPAGARTPARRSCLSSGYASDEAGARRSAAPRFSSRRLGQPGYLYAAPGYRCEVDIGASDGQAIGAFHNLGEALRYDNCADALTEHLPFQLRAVTAFIT